ncbi:hybrid sensor histidine kinase/response regulator [Leptolyngbya ohadii]|uniref:hybrid sensor histidine kinase/response regulator n=1 Tax=Leptolyngbya ohadii TaxID=1962290 RepID=UPI000B59AD55|nr:response regulator [Leptolyngbya ohadii]
MQNDAAIADHQRLLTVLTVDDNEATRYMVARMLRQAGFEVKEAATGEEALRLAAEQPDLILLDVKLPDISGLEVCRRIKNNPITAGIPVLHLSANFVSPASKAEGLEGGADGYLTQPIEPMELVAAVRAFLRNYLQKQTLHQAQMELEAKVQERTAEIAAMNQRLQAEIAERRQTEAALQDSESRFRAIFDQTFQFVGLLKPDGTLLEANQTAMDFGGISREQVIDRPFWEAFWWCHSAAAQTQLQRAIQEAAAGRFIRYKVEVQGNNGVRATIDFSLKPLRDQFGQTAMLIAEGRDITELERAQAALQAAHAELEKRVEARTAELLQANQSLQQEIHDRQQAQAALQDSENRLRSFVEANVIGILFGTVTGEILETNDKFLDMIGYSREEMEAGWIGWKEITPPEFLPLDEMGIAEAKATGTCTPYEKEYIRKDGSRIPVLIGYVLLGQERHHSVVFILDITERKQVERDRQQLLEQEQTARLKAEELNRLKDEFIATVSHELRTPLNAILGWSRLLQSRRLEEATVNRALETIERNARVQAQLVEDLLEVSRLIRGKIKLHVRSVNLAEVIRAALNTVMLAAEAKRIRLELSCPIEVSIAGDSDRLQQVVWNLLSNAIKFTPEGGRVQVRLEQVSREVGSGEWAVGSREAQGSNGAGKQPSSLAHESNDFPSSPDYSPTPSLPTPYSPTPLPTPSLPTPYSPSFAQIAITDTGQGIDPEFLPHVFDRFRQADGSTTRVQGGLGLGLAIVRQLVELHGGAVLVNSAGRNQGTTFTVRLPLTSGVNSANGSASNGKVAPDPSSLNRSPMAAEFPCLSGVQVLAVDDEPDAREFVSEVLSQCGAVVTVASSTQEALTLLEHGSYDILLSDIGMPGSDGYALIQHIRSNPSTHFCRIPAIALTAYARVEDRVRALNAGFQNHVPKPVEPIELAAVVANLMGVQSPICPAKLPS